MHIPLGFSMELPEGHAAILAPRSGLGSKGIVLGNLIGVLDEDFRGECCAVVWNRNGQEEQSCFKVNPGDRIAQMLIVPIARPTLIEVDHLSDTARGTGGFGSTGA